MQEHRVLYAPIDNLHVVIVRIDNITILKPLNLQE